MQNNTPDRKGLAIAALVVGIFAIVLFFIPFASIILGIAGIIMGIMSLKSSKRGLAIGGLVTAIVGLILGGFITVCTLFFYGSVWPGIANDIYQETCDAYCGSDGTSRIIGDTCYCEDGTSYDLD